MSTLNKFIIRYCKMPTNYNDPRNAIVEAEDAEMARKLVLDKLGEGNGVENYVVDVAKPHEPPKSAGKVLTLNG